VIRVDNVSKKWPNGAVVLDGVSFDVPLGSVTVILGPSGAGKTTLLRIVANLEEPDGGRILNPHGQPGMVFQGGSLWPHLTLLDNVSLPLRLVRHEDSAVARGLASEILSSWGLRSRLNAYPAELSAGEQQRGALARALVLSPSVLCLDEITSSLDPETAAGILQTLLKLKTRDMAILLATHHIAFASAVADEAILLDGGRVVETGPKNSMIVAPKTSRTRAFLGAAIFSVTKPAIEDEVYR
jgi:ABC-type polar amino acid transport system ATPase subunit